jgi:hypothetical protein
VALNFPDSPTLGQIYTFANKSWTYDGQKWIVSQYDNAISQDVIDYIDAKAAETLQESITFSVIFA